MVERFISTYSGARFYYANPQEITIEDVAHQLSLVNRFAGATRFAYSVAQHSVFVSEIMRIAGFNPEARRAGLLHDAHEYVMSDIPTPFQLWFKECITEGFDYIEVAKNVLDDAIMPRLEAPWPLTSAVKTGVKLADELAFLTEATQLFKERPEWLDERLQNSCLVPLTQSIYCKSAAEAEQDFLALNNQLLDEISGRKFPSDAVAA